MIVINGASGWMGRSAIRALVEMNPNLNRNNFVFLGSKQRIITDPTLGEITITDIKDILDIDECEFFFQLSFKTKDYLNILGSDAYVKQNMEIIENSSMLFEKIQPKNVVLISSGVVSKYYENGMYNDEYTHLKIMEESVFSKLASECGSNISVGRLWGSTGILMPDPLKYAVGDLIHQAISSDKIQINSKNYVYRRYIDSVEFFKVLIENCRRGNDLLIDSGGCIIEIEQLARLILMTLDLKKPIIRDWDDSCEPDHYFSSSTQFECLSAEFGFTISDMTKQIVRTSKLVLS